MTDDEKLALLASKTSEKDEDVLKGYLADAASSIMERRYPYVADKSNLVFPARYDRLQVRLAVIYWAKRGAEGESSHNENGVSRQYETEDALLSQVLPYVGPRQLVTS